MSDRTGVALTHLADFLTVGALGMQTGAVDDLVALPAPAQSWPVRPDGTQPGSAHQAAMTNAVAAHLLDWDDVLLGVPTHPGVVIWPALLAVSRPTTTVRDAVDGYLLGLAMARELAGCFDAEHYARGWHATTTIGRMAAAYTAAQSRHGDRAVAWRALQLAATDSSGVTDVFGSVAKPVQVGLAAGGAALAALLAPGMTDMPDVLTPDTRLGALLGLRRRPDHPHDDDRSAAVTALRLKRYPCCYFAHAPLAAAAVGRESRAWLGGPVTLRVSPLAGRICAVAVPATVDEARFSLPYLVAAAARDWPDDALGLVDGSLLRDGDVARRAAGVEVVADPSLTDMSAVLVAGQERHRVDLDEPGPGSSTETVIAKATRLDEPLRSTVLRLLTSSSGQRTAILGTPLAELAAPIRRPNRGEQQ